MSSTKTPRETVERLRAMLRRLRDTGHRDIKVYLGPYHYEHLLIIKGLPHGLGVLTCWGPYRDGRPITQFAGYPLHYMDTGASYIGAVRPGHGRREYRLT